MEKKHKTRRGRIRSMKSQVDEEGAGNKPETYQGRVESLIAALLLSVQTLTKSHPTSNSGGGQGKRSHSIPGDEDIEEGETMLEGHLVAHVYEKLKGDKQCLELNKITQSLQSLITEVLDLTESGSRSDVLTLVQILGQCQALVQQYRVMLEYYLLQYLAEIRVTGKLLSVLLAVFTELTSKGFCVPAEFEDEVAGEGATDFEDIEGGGLGQGEGVKDVSDQIENEDQLDEARKAGEDSKEDPAQQPDVRSEENAIEMSDDFEGRVQDLEAADQEERSDGEEEREEELDKQMGEVDGDDTDKLDEQMWGSDEEQGEEQGDKEEFGPGSQQEERSELVAKDDNPDKSESGDKPEKQTSDENEAEEDEDKQTSREQEQIDESEYDDDRIDPHHGNQEPEEAPDNMDLPDDLKLDEEEAGVTEEEQGQDETPTEPPGGDTEMPDDKGDNNDPGQMEEEEEETLPEVERDLSEEKDTQSKEEPDKGQETRSEDGEGDPGFSAQQNDAPEINEAEQDESPADTDDKPQATENYGKTSHSSEDVEHSESAQDQGGEADNEQKESDGTGTSNSEVQEGHEGQSSKVAPSSSSQAQKPAKRKAGQSSEDRSLGSRENQFKKLKTIEESSSKEQDEEKDESTKKESQLYEHIKDATSTHDAQVIDVATEIQQVEQAMPDSGADQESGEVEDDSDDVEMKEEEKTEDIVDKLSSMTNSKEKQKKKVEGMKEEETEENLKEAVKYQTEGVAMETLGAARGPESTIHTSLENLHLDVKGSDLERLRSELEEHLSSFCNVDNPTPEAEALASEAWHQYEALTSALSQELCEQLRLVLEPSQATKLRGDYRTGKRLNMRKVIPYIASQFRKDKIWLRRTKPSKRQYQIMLAIDDSSSMVDNHSKQLAYESLALISNALTLLEAGELCICSFGESVRVLHPFNEQFSSHSGSRLLQQFTFEQKKTKVAQLLKKATSIMMDARSKQRGMMGNPETSQLLLIVSDGRGLFSEGMETVKSAVRQAREANVFLVFVVIDNPQNKDSILDIKVPVFKSGNQLPEIKPYMDYFPFPFYIILRDINSLPHVLCDALRQWFELVTAVDM